MNEERINFNLDHIKCAIYFSSVKCAVCCVLCVVILPHCESRKTVFARSRKLIKYFVSVHQANDLIRTIKLFLFSVFFFVFFVSNHFRSHGI